MYGPITTLQCDGHLVKYILWTAFKMFDRDWHRVVDAQDILKMGIVFSFNGNRLIAI